MQDQWGGETGLVEKGSSRDGHCARLSPGVLGVYVLVRRQSSTVTEDQVDHSDNFVLRMTFFRLETPLTCPHLVPPGTYQGANELRLRVEWETLPLYLRGPRIGETDSYTFRRGWD